MATGNDRDAMRSETVIADRPEDTTSAQVQAGPRLGVRRPAQALAAIATIGILHERIVSDAVLVQEQLRRAFATRVVIEQAKGALGQQRYISTDEAFQLLRQHARATHTKIGDVAQAVVDGTLHL